ncbi:hypothetical protein GETHPA_19040 [Geothrix rubra]|uniref:Uncharacterized protein n=1 Tax=Geothrix rubra TaxID=2927977 RepID=A0ABQ5Q7J0_9BACT|nr:hypothetical protein [Geothrix rubra]GLH70371.1 hypothetical protein GETHPA_19040 [Geothrix rubra]
MTIHHHPEPKPKMGKVRNPALPVGEPKPDPELPRPTPELSPRPGREVQPAPSSQGARPPQNPQTAKPGLYLPPPTDALPKTGADAAKRDAKPDEEDETRPGMHQPKAGLHHPRTMKK